MSNYLWMASGFMTGGFLLGISVGMKLERLRQRRAVA